MLGPIWRIFRRGRKPQDSVAARWRRSYVLASLAAAIAGVALSIAAGTGVWLHENQLAEVELGDRADNHALLLQYGIKEDLKALSGLRARFQSADGEIGRREFASFSGLLLRDQPAIQSLAWAPRVTRAERDAFELAATRDGIPGFQIKAVTASGLARSEEREEYFPILYSATGAASSSVYGLDLNSEPMRRDTLERARDSGKPAASSVFRLPAEIGDWRAFFVVVPVFKARIASTIPWKAGAATWPASSRAYFASRSWSRRSSPELPRPPASISTCSATADERGGAFVYFHSSRRRTTPAEPQPLAKLTAGPQLVDRDPGRRRAVDDGRRADPRRPRHANHYAAWLVLAGGLLVTAAVVAYIWAAGRQSVVALKPPTRSCRRRTSASMRRCRTCCRACSCSTPSSGWSSATTATSRCTGCRARS